MDREPLQAVIDQVANGGTLLLRVKHDNGDTEMLNIPGTARYGQRVRGGGRFETSGKAGAPSIAWEWDYRSHADPDAHASSKNEDWAEGTYLCTIPLAQILHASAEPSVVINGHVKPVCVGEDLNDDPNRFGCSIIHDGIYRGFHGLVSFGGDAPNEMFVPSADIQSRVFYAGSPAAVPTQIRTALKDSEVEVRIAAARNPAAGVCELDLALDDESSWVRAAAVAHPNATETQINMGLMDDDEHVRAAAGSNPNATRKQIDLAISDESSVVQARAIRNPSTDWWEQVRGVKLADNNRVRTASATAHSSDNWQLARRCESESVDV